MAKQRDMTAAQFRAACQRNGFRKVLVWLEDTSGQTRTSYGMVMIGGKFNRRVSLAHAISERAKDAAKSRPSPVAEAA